ncbi:MAG: hypothetical protein KBT36_01515 [Kurthia sp.]|nr:hypothetical protein [Candidatus Kurthia equi]
MKCQHEGCQIEVNYLICEVKTKEYSGYRCLNHVLIDLEVLVHNLKEMKPIDEKCECCDTVGVFKINYGGDGEIRLCLEDMIALLELRLEPQKFKALYEKYPNQHILHDDFYCEVTGEALQPRKII